MAEVSNNNGINKENKEHRRYVCPAGKASMLKTVSLGLLVIITILFVLEVTYQHVGMVVLASVLFSAIPLLFSWIALLRMMRTGQEMSEDDYKKGVFRLQQNAALVMLFTAAAVFGVGERLFKGEYDSLVVYVGMLVRSVAQLAASLILALISMYHCSQIKKS